MANGLVTSQQSGIEELQQVPEFAKIVLHRRTGEQQARTCLERHDGRGRLRLAVLDGMCLVEAHNIPIHLCQFFLHLWHESVSGEHHIASRCFLKHLLAVVGMIEQHDVERWSKACQLAFPVGNDGRWRNDQGRSQYDPISSAQLGQGKVRVSACTTSARLPILNAVGLPFNFRICWMSAL